MPKKIIDDENEKNIVDYDDLIIRIVDTEKLFGISNIYIYLNKNCQYYSLASAYALERYLTKIGFNVYIVLKGSVILAKNFAFEKVIQSKDIKHNSNNFLGIAIDCDKIDEIENKSWNESFILFEVKGSSHLNNFGVIGFSRDDITCSAEVIYASIKKYEKIKKHKDLDEVYAYLKMALLNASVNFVSKPRSLTLNILKSLKKYETPKDITLTEEKLIIMQVLQNIYYNTKFKNGIAITSFDKTNGLNKINIKTIKKCLRFVKYIDIADYWYITIEQLDGTFRTLIQCSKTNNLNKKNSLLEKQVKRNKGTIDSGIGEFIYGKKKFDLIGEFSKMDNK